MSANCLQEVVVNLEPGTQYWYTPMDLKGKKQKVGPYLIIAVGKHVHHNQEMVVYQAVQGGQVWIASMIDFYLKFVEVEQVDKVVDPPPPEKVLDHTIKGSGA